MIPLQYFLRLRDERSALTRLDDILGSETRNAVAKHESVTDDTTKDRVAQTDQTLGEASDQVSTLPHQCGQGRSGSANLRECGGQIG